MTTQQFLTSSWTLNPFVIGLCLVALALYAKVVRFHFQPQTAYFAVAVGLFFLTLASPVNTLANGYLFSAHMLQHLLLLLAIPPLALLGLPERKRDASTNSIIDKINPHPFASWLAGLSAMWIWHERTLCDVATRTQAGRITQIVSLLVLGIVFWWPIVGPQPQRRLMPLLGVIYLFSACIGCTILGILITFAPVGVVCPVYLHPVDRLGILPLIRDQWGITPGKDQQIGGLLMWVPACGIYLSGVFILLLRWFKVGEAVHEIAPSVVAEPAQASPSRVLQEKI